MSGANCKLMTFLRLVGFKRDGHGLKGLGGIALPMDPCKSEGVGLGVAEMADTRIPRACCFTLL